MTAALVSSPHAKAPNSVARTMALVMAALVPTTAYGFYAFGWPAVFLFTVTAATAVVAEAACLWVAGKPVRPFVLDGSALLTGWLLALTLPPWAPWWIGVIGSLVAIVIAKQAFGGLGQNLFNPAMVARVALLISFPLEMTTFIAPHSLLSNQAPGLKDSLAITFDGSTSPDAMSSASILGHVRTELTMGLELPAILGTDYNVTGLALGNVEGSLGETSALLILLGGLFLLYKGVISWHIPVSLLGTLALLATAFNLFDPEHYPGAIYHLLSGASLLGAFFIATDLVTSPVSIRGQLLFGAGCGALIYVIRTWAGYPEGVAFAVILMNACTPMIDHYLKPRVYGRDRGGEPLVYADDAEKRP